MTLQQRLSAFITAVGADVKGLYSRAMPSGGTAGQTLTKTGAGDYQATWTTPSATGATIDDSTSVANKVYSSSKTDAQIANAKAAVKSEILGGASAAYDTLQEIQGLLQTEDNAINALVTAVGSRVDVAAAQSFTNPQKIQARANIGAYGVEELGNPDTDLAALYTSAKA